MNTFEQVQGRMAGAGVEPEGDGSRVNKFEQVHVWSQFKPSPVQTDRQTLLKHYIPTLC